eukprot:7022117-Alexandrium_andersonii.AAC.1
MVRWSALGKHGFGLPQLKVSAPVRLLPGAPKLLSSGLLCKNMGFGFLWPTLPGRNSCSHRGTSLGGWVSGL